MDYTVHRILQAEPRSPTLQGGYLPVEPQGKPNGHIRNPPNLDLYHRSASEARKASGFLGKLLCTTVFFVGKGPELTSNLKKSKNICNQGITIGVLELECDARYD